MASHSSDGNSAFSPVVYCVTDAQTSLGSALVACLLDRQPESAVVALISTPEGAHAVEEALARVTATPYADVGSTNSSSSSSSQNGRLTVLVHPTPTLLEDPPLSPSPAMTIGSVPVVQQHGIDVLVLGAATAIDACASCDSATHLDYDGLKRHMDVLVGGTSLAVQHLLPFVRKGKQRRIVGLVTISGSCGLLSRGRLSDCSASGGTATAALIHYLKRLSIDLKPEGINVAIFSPGFVRDDPTTTAGLTPASAVSTPDEAARNFYRTFVLAPARETGSHVDQHGQIVPW